jgi:hypothetical protein
MKPDEKAELLTLMRSTLNCVQVDNYREFANQWPRLSELLGEWHDGVQRNPHGTH